MATLVIHAPSEKSRSEGKKSFEKTFATGKGRGYAIARRLYEQVEPGCPVVLLSKDEGKRAEGRLVKLVPTVKAGNGIQRYDVYVEKLRRVRYTPEELNRNGVAVV